MGHATIDSNGRSSVIKLTSLQTSELLDQPETGMGYQAVEVGLAELRRGIVQPDFGHTVGGVEVLFDNGTDDGTVSGPKVLPP
jgi:hypothetical protein